MSAPVPIPASEQDRLDQLRALFILDSAPEPVFDSIARLASEICGVPIALMSLIDEERQWFKANVGLPGVNETPRDIAFCAHAISGDEIFEVADATRDPRFAANPLVTGTPDIRFYAGAPLVLPGGQRVGTLCVIDRQPRHLEAAQLAMLRALARIATDALVMRRDLVFKALAVRTAYEQALSQSELRYRALVDDQAELVSLARADGELVYVNRAYARHFGREPDEMVGHNLFDFVDPADRAAVNALVTDVLRSGGSRSSENRMVAADGTERWVAWTNMLQRGASGQAMLHSVGRDVSERKRDERALRASQTFLARTGRVAGVGGWELHLASGALTWSDETRRIHDVGPDYVPTLEGAIAFYAPQARAGIEAAVQIGMRSGEGWDLELPFITATGRHIWVRAVGEVEFEGGAPVRLVGAFQDITERKRLEQALRELGAVLENTIDYVVQTDWHGQITYMNPAARRVAGLTPTESVTHRNFAEFNTAATNRHFAEVIVPAVKANDVWLGNTTVYAADRRELPVSHLVIAHRDELGRVERFSAVMRDISSELEAQQLLERQTATLRSVTEAIPAMVAVVGADERYRFVNSSFERWIGASRDRIIGRTLLEVLGRTEYERSRPWVARVLAGETVNFEKDYAGRGVARHLAMSHVPLWLANGGVDGFVGMAQDITQHRQEEVRLLQLTQRDALTGLLNRAGFEEHLKRSVHDGGIASLALLYIDLDHFKRINDEYGHPMGDQVLQQFAQRLGRLVRPTDAVSRLGGDEFAIVLAGIHEIGNARAVADKVIVAAHTPFDVGALRLTIGASIGVAFGIDPTKGWRELVERADARLYEAKAAGRGRFASSRPGVGGAHRAQEDA